MTRANACDAASSALQLRLDFSTPPAKQQSRRSASPLVTPCPAIPARYFTRAEAAAYIRCSLRFLDGMSLPFIRKGRCKVYDRIDLDAYMQDDRHRGRAYGLVLPDGRRVCQSTGCINRTDAEAPAVRLKNEALEARQQGLLGIFVWQQAVVRYLEELADKRSLSDDKDHLKKLDPYLRSLKLEAIDMTVLQPFIRDRKLKDGVSNATVNRALEVVRRILNVAHQDWRWLRGMPKIRMLKEPRRRVRFLRREEADRLMETLPTHMKPIVEFALATGCRAGEILGARMEPRGSGPESGLARSRHDEVGRRARHSAERGRRGGAGSHAGTAPALVFHLRRPTHPAELDRMGQGKTACRDRRLPLPRSEALSALPDYVGWPQASLRATLDLHIAPNECTTGHPT